MKLPEGYPTNIDLPNRDVYFEAEKPSQVGFRIAESHRNPYNKSQTMKAPEGMSRRWPGTLRKKINPSERPAEYLFWLTSPQCGDHPDFDRIGKHKNIRYRLYDPERGVAEKLERQVKVSEAMEIVRQLGGTNMDEMNKNEKELNKALVMIDEKQRASGPLAMDSLMEIAISAPDRILDALSTSPKYAMSDKLQVLVEKGTIVVRRGFYGYEESGTGFQSIGDLETINDIILNEQNPKHEWFVDKFMTTKKPAPKKRSTRASSK